MTKKLSQINTQDIKIIFLIFAFYLLPPIAIVIKLIPFSVRFILLTFIGLLMFFIRPSQGTSNIDLGITRKNFEKSIYAIIPLTLLLGLPMILLSLVNDPRIDNSELSIYFYLFYVLISCPLQEFAYRGYLFHLLEVLALKKWTRIIIAAALYSFVHIIFVDIYIVIATLLVGILWNIHYDRYRNLASVTLSHSILGVLSILFGLI
ncbi:MAG: CPBP family intramembrane metalloprotease [Symploca sp. SIO1C2]|nr:CPBP family intramembrane metalloprotease [Symploca sp. SIO1C2]